MSKLNTGQIAGGNSEYREAVYDYSATNPKDMERMLKMMYRHGIEFPGNRFLEPCAGGGHIIEACKSSSYMPKDQQWTAIDIVDRGYPLDFNSDFLALNITEHYDGVISNPPFQRASEFIEKSINLLSDNGICMMFLKLHFLEGSGRRELFDMYPPKYIYVYRNRANPWREGSPVNPFNGKEWASAICFAWFIWQKGSDSEPIIRWVDDVDYTTKNKRLF
jgi:hypothetical protein